jgi:hypothetical protein
MALQSPLRNTAIISLQVNTYIKNKQKKNTQNPSILNALSTFCCSLGLEANYVYFTWVIEILCCTMLPLVFSVAHLVISQGQLQVSVMPSVLARSGFAGKLKEVTRSRGQLHIGSFIASNTTAEGRQVELAIPASYRRRINVAQSQLQSSSGLS